MTGERPSTIDLAAAVALGVAVVALAVRLSFLTFPPGADPGKWLAAGWALSGRDVLGAPSYGPLVPAVLHVLQLVLPAGALLVALKIAAVGLFAAQVAALGGFTFVLFGRHAAAWAVLFAAVDPFATFQVLWGGYPQFAGVVCGVAALAALVWTERERGVRSGAVAAVLFALTLAAHPFTAVPVAVAAVVFVGIGARADRAAARHGVRVGVAAAALVLPIVPWLTRFITAIRPPAPSTGVTAERVAAAVIERFVAWPASLVLGVALFGACVTAWLGRRRSWTPALRVAVGLAVGFAVVAVATPIVLSGRLVVLAFVFVVPFAAAGAAQWRPSRSAIVAAALLLTVPVTVGNAVGALEDHAPVGADTLAAAEALRGRDGGVLVLSPWANADGWWLAGLTGRTPVIADSPVWAVTRDAVERAIVARSAVFGVDVLDGGDLKVLDGGAVARDANPELWVWSGLDYHPVAALADNAVRLDAKASDGTRFTAALAQGNVTPSVSEGLAYSAATSWWRVERSVHGVDGAASVTLRYRFALTDDANATWAGVSLPFTASSGTHFAGAAIDGTTARLQHRFPWASSERDVVVTASSDGFTALEFVAGGTPGFSRLVINVTAPPSVRTLQVDVTVAVEGVTVDGWSRTTAEALLASFDVTDVVVRGGHDRVAARFDADPAWQAAETFGDVRVWRRA